MANVVFVVWAISHIFLAESIGTLVSFPPADSLPISFIDLQQQLKSLNEITCDLQSADFSVFCGMYLLTDSSKLLY